MCVIIHNPKAKTIPLDIFDAACSINPDGFGIFYHDNGEILHTMDYNDLEDLMYGTKRGYTAHFRYATSGVVDKDSCHPFDINERYALMMNGTIDRLVSKSKVDTEALCEILNGMTYKQMIHVLQTYKCRFSLLDKKTGESSVVNRDLWHKRGNVLYSKDNVFNLWSSRGKSWGKSNTSQAGTSKKKAAGDYGPVIYTPETCGGIGWNNRHDEYDSNLDDYWNDYVDGDDSDESWDEWCARMGYEDEAEAFADVKDGEIEPPAGVDDTWYADLDPALPSDVAKLEGEDDETTRIAVYGTLKKGKGNHPLLDGCEFLGHGTTLDTYPMVAQGCPFVIDEKDNPDGKHIVVEVYRVDAIALRDIDRLEGHPDWYVRRIKPIVMDATGDVLECYVYVQPKECAAGIHGYGDSTQYIKCF